MDKYTTGPNFGLDRSWGKVMALQVIHFQAPSFPTGLKNMLITGLQKCRLTFSQPDLRVGL